MDTQDPNKTNDDPNKTNDDPNKTTVPAFAEVSNDPSPLNEVDPPTKHSGLGIASTILGALAIVLVIVVINQINGNMELLQSFAEQTLDPDNLTEAQEDGLGTVMLIGLLSILIFGSMVIGFILGLIGLLKKNRLKTFPVIGLVLSISPILISIISSLF